MNVVLNIKNLKKHFVLKKIFQPAKILKALDGISFQLKTQETLAIVGESGCGKSTLAKTLMQIEKKSEGSIQFDSLNIEEIFLSDFYKKIQMVFQDPYSSINPRRRAWQIISEPLVVNQKVSVREAKEKALEMMIKVGLRPEMGDRYPHMFSGGQRQRIGIARALMLRPKVLICDEPVSALDVSIQAQVINLLLELQDELKLSLLFISHDLSVVRHIADRVLVMYLGKIVEIGTRDQIFESPQHPYTKLLLASRPGFKKDFKDQEYSVSVQSALELPSPVNPPTGCHFHKRCSLATEDCLKSYPELLEKNKRLVACFKV